MEFNCSKCEQLIGYTFSDKNLLKTAFTHASYTNENGGTDNERLEFLGDSVLGLIITEMLYQRFKNDDEGVLTKRKQALVSKAPLSAAIIKSGLDKFILLGQGEEKQFELNKINLSENLFEALTAAIYLDGGLDNARKFIFSLLDLEEIVFANSKESASFNNDYKTELQHYVQGKHLGKISYEEVSVLGPPHDPRFTMAVLIDGKVCALGEGKSHKQAGQDAAKIALKILKGEGN